jgi:hypothetical protein
MATSNINRVVLTGNLTRDPVLRNTNSGTPVCGLRIASNTRRKTSSGEWVDTPNYLNVTVRGALGETCHRFLAKGRPVAIDGNDSTVGARRRSQLGQRYARTSPRGSRLGVTADCCLLSRTARPSQSLAGHERLGSGRVRRRGPDSGLGAFVSRPSRT